MPILNGVKFSCEPCMRGHRSSKCNHTDRILVKVRKPGRPLSSCPHTLSSSSPGTFVHSSPGAISSDGDTAAGTNTYGEVHGGNSCSCEVTSVAIPKFTSCVCGVSGSASKSHASCKASKSSTCVEANPLPSPVPSRGSSMFSMNKVAGSRHRVQRKSVAGVDGSTTRRASLIGDDTAMEFLWKAQQEAGSPDVKAEKGSGYSMIEADLMGADTRGDGRSRYTNGDSCTGGAVDRFSTNPKDSLQGREFPVAVGATFSPSNGVPTPKPDMGNGTVLMDGWNSTLDIPLFEEAPPTDPPHMVKPGGGCCSSSRSASQTPQTNFDQRPSTVLKPVAPYCNGGAGGGGSFAARPELSQMPVPSSQFFASPQHSPTYGTTNPLEASLPRPTGPSTVTLTARELAWVQYLRATGFSSPPPPLEAGFLPDFQVTSGGEEGCISHPYNPRTVEYVKGLRSFALDDQPMSPFHSQSNSPTLPQSHLNGSANGVEEAGDPIASVHRHTATTRANINLIIQTPPPPSPDRESSAGAPENGVSPSAFVLVDYQIGPCSEAETECKCGDGCICLDCLSHGKKYGVEMVRGAQWDASGLNGAGSGVAAGPNWWGFGSNSPVEANSWNSV
ncbi:hypothetical protein C7212DRAFT_359897 [Tuber magnatum]|uniref:Copper-fist domain-containing protein n=1 Tax=Tuber magnatum TaxID=42249 RepID=A0A317SEK1_9PEZI|nr:hypothetical protein C7212DRAFT_359897 [Tuber magnatum]